jgi:hypothetical protein
MLRTRQIAASPLRSASATWTVITNLVADTVARSTALTRAEAEQALSAAGPVGRMLIAGSHLDRYPVTLVVGTVHCEITTISGTAALTAEENLNPIPGAAGADCFTIHLPSPDPLQEQVKTAVAGHPRLSDAAPPAPEAKAVHSGPLIDHAALRRAVAER